MWNDLTPQPTLWSISTSAQAVMMFMKKLRGYVFHSSITLLGHYGCIDLFKQHGTTDRALFFLPDQQLCIPNTQNPNPKHLYSYTDRRIHDTIPAHSCLIWRRTPPTDTAHQGLGLQHCRNPLRWSTYTHTHTHTHVRDLSVLDVLTKGKIRRDIDLVKTDAPRFRQQSPGRAIWITSLGRDKRKTLFLMISKYSIGYVVIAADYHGYALFNFTWFSS